MPYLAIFIAVLTIQQISAAPQTAPISAATKAAKISAVPQKAPISSAPATATIDEAPAGHCTDLIRILSAFSTSTIANQTNVVVQQLIIAEPLFAQLKSPATYDAIDNTLESIARNVNGSALIDIAQQVATSSPARLAPLAQQWANAVRNAINATAQSIKTLYSSNTEHGVNAAISGLATGSRQLLAALKSTEAGFDAAVVGNVNVNKRLTAELMQMLAITGGVLQINVGLIYAVYQLLQTKFEYKCVSAQQALQTLRPVLGNLCASIVKLVKDNQ